MNIFKQNQIIRSLALGALCFSSTISLAQEDTDTLPKGIFRARVVGVFTETIGNTYNANGQLQGLAQSLNRSVTVKDFVQQEPKLQQLMSALNTLQPGLGNQLGASNLYAQSSLQVENYMPALEYGLTDRMSLGIRAPIVKRTSRNSFSAAGINNATEIQKQMGLLGSGSINTGLEQFSKSSFDTGFFSQSLFTSRGYEAPSNFQKTELGDAEAGWKWNFFRNSHFSAASQVGMRFPTGSTPSLTNLFDQGSGGGSYALGVSYYQDVYPTPWLTFGLMGKGLQYFSDTRARAVPKDSSDALPSLRPQDGQVQPTTRSPGIEFQGELSTTAQFFERKFSLWFAYQHSQKGDDAYRGPGNLDYRSMALDTGWVKRSVEVGTSLYTVPWFRKKQFPVPARLNLIYNTTVSGVNTALVSFVRTDFIVFF